MLEKTVLKWEGAFLFIAKVGSLVTKFNSTFVCVECLILMCLLWVGYMFRAMLVKFVIAVLYLRHGRDCIPNCVLMPRGVSVAHIYVRILPLYHL